MSKLFTALTLSFLVIFAIGCNKEPDKLLVIKEQLIGNWTTIDYRFGTEDWSGPPKPGLPYIILEEYGSGFDLDADHYYTHYNESLPTNGLLRGTWKVIDETTLAFNSSQKPSFEVKIIELEDNFLWISGANVEYKLKRIE